MIHRAALRCIAAALILAELRRTRGADGMAGVVEPVGWSDKWPLGEAGLGMDSLEAVNIAAAFSEMFHLDESESPFAVPNTFGGWLDTIEAAQRAGVTRLTVLTSGSAGIQQPCIHDIADLTSEADYFGHGYASRARIVALVPAHHIYGLIWTALLPARLGIPVIVAAAGAMPRLQPGDLIVAVPTLWQYLLRSRRHWPADVEGVSAGAPLDAHLAKDLKKAGLARLTDIYGASETGGIAFRDAPGDTYTLLPRWRFARPFDADMPRLLDTGGRDVLLPDHIHLCANGGFALAGRRDGAVQVGGINVWPRHVASVLQRCPGIADIAVRLGSDERLKAYVVPGAHSDIVQLHAQVHAYAARTLSASERPISYRFGEALPYDSFGKAMDWT